MKNGFPSVSAKISSTTSAGADLPLSRLSMVATSSRGSPLSFIRVAIRPRSKSFQGLGQAASDVDFSITVGTKEHHGKIRDSLCKVIEQRQAGIVGPVKVFYDHQSWLFGSDTGDEVEEAIEQMTTRLQRRQIQSGWQIRQNAPQLWEQPRQLRCFFRQLPAQLLGFCYAIDEPLEHFDEGQERDGFLKTVSDPDR
jgi:hypothetical protein